MRSPSPKLSVLAEKPSGFGIFGYDAHRALQYGRIVQCNDPAVRAAFDMNPCRAPSLIEMPAAEIIANDVDIQIQFIGNPLRTAAGQFVLDTTQLVKCNYHNV